MPSLALEHTQIFYETIGSGSPCFVLHGGLGLDHTYFRPWLDPLADQVSLFYLDHRGNGRSGRPPLETLTFEQFCADIEALRVALSLPQIILLGHSYGGFIALEYARRYSAQVSHLVLVDTVAALDFHQEIEANLERRNLSAEIRAALAASPSSDEAFRNVMETVLPLYFHRFDPVVARAAFQQVRWNLKANLRGFELLETYNMRPHLHTLELPSLCIAGASDFLALPSQVQRLGKELATANVVIFEDCGHFAFIEQPQAFLETVRSWLQQQNLE